MPRLCASRGVLIDGTSSPSISISPASGDVDAAEDLDDRRLAAAVLADERVHLAGAQLEGRVAHGLGRAERLGEVGDAQQRGRPVVARRPRGSSRHRAARCPWRSPSRRPGRDPAPSAAAHKRVDANTRSRSSSSRRQASVEPLRQNNVRYQIISDTGLQVTVHRFRLRRGDALESWERAGHAETAQRRRLHPCRCRPRSSVRAFERPLHRSEHLPRRSCLLRGLALAIVLHLIH